MLCTSPSGEESFLIGEYVSMDARERYEAWLARFIERKVHVDSSLSSPAFSGCGLSYGVIYCECVRESQIQFYTKLFCVTKRSFFLIAGWVFDPPGNKKRIFLCNKPGGTGKGSR